MKLWEIIREMEKREQDEGIELDAAAEAKAEDQKKYARGQIRVVRGTMDRVTIMASAENEDNIQVIYNRNGRRATLKKSDTVDFVR